MATDLQLYKGKNEWLASRFKEVTPEQFYKDIFPLDLIEIKGDTSEHHPNPIFSYTCKSADGRRYHQNEIVFRDTFDEALSHTYKNPFAICSMCSYSGRNKTAANAYKLHGICIDLDDVGVPQLDALAYFFYETQELAVPTYIANSGKGVHIYYIFNQPIPLYPALVPHLQKLKRGLTMRLWNNETSTKAREFQGIYQGFRMPGSSTKLGQGKAKGKYLVRVFDVWSNHKISIEYLNKFVYDDYKMPIHEDWASDNYDPDDHITIEMAQNLWPDWYQRRIVEKQPAGQWKAGHGLYDWWLNYIRQPGIAKDGNRYHCISALFIFAQKCLLPEEVPYADALELVEVFDELTMSEHNHFTENDIWAASEFYKPKYAKMSFEEIQRRCQTHYHPTARRNGRAQEEHLRRARHMRELASYENVGRPEGSAEKDAIAKYKQENPGAAVKDCVAATGISKSTVYRWWKQV